MNSFHHTNAFHFRVVLRIAVPRFARDISFQPRSVPHFDSFVIRRRDEEGVVRGYGEPCDRICVRVEMRDEICFRAFICPVARYETVAAGGTAADRSFMCPRPEVALQILASVEVHML